jgi:hypothetical protein
MMNDGIRLHREERGELSGGAASGALGGASVARLDEGLVAICAGLILRA